jgi:hypothetical protein
MGWFRTNRRGGGALALLALLIQLAVAFGHVHARPAQVSALAAPIAAVLATSPAGDPALDPDHPAAGLACDLCAILSLGSTADTPQAPVVLALPRVAASPVWHAGANVVVARRHLAAQSRAPPAA